MSLTDKTLKSKLAKYSKADIIDAVCNEFGADHIVRSMLIFLEYKTNQLLIDEERKAFKASSEAGEAYIAWESDMIKRFGDGKSVSYSNIPSAELKKGGMLGDAWKAAIKKADAASDKLNRALGISMKPESRRRADHENKR